MSKHFKFLVLALLLVGLMAGSAFAGTTRVNHGAVNTAFTMSLEGAAATRQVNLANNPVGGGTNAALSYTTTQALTGTNLIKVSFSGAAFNGSAINVCAYNGSLIQPMATATPAAGTTSQNFQTTVAMSAGQVLYVTNEACANGGGSNMPVRTDATSSAVTATATIEILTSGGISIDTASTANAVNIRSEYAGQLRTLGAHVIDYLGTPGDGTRFTAQVNGATNQTAQSVNFATANQVVANNLTTIGMGGLSVGAVIGLSDNAGWAGVSKVFVNAAAANCADNAGSNLVGTGSPSGTISLTVPQAAFNGTATTNFDLCILANGTTALMPRTITGNVDINVTGTGANDPAAPALANADGWTVNAFQAMLPWGINSTLAPTYCLISNADTSRTASVIMDILSSETAVTMSNQSLGTIAPKTAKLVTVTGDNVSMAGGSNVSVSTLGSNTRHMDRFTVTVNPANVTMSCQQTDPVTGSKRPVLTLH